MSALRRAVVSVVSLSMVAVGAVVATPAARAAAGPCDPPVANPVVCENSKTGNAKAEWDVSGAGDPTIQGFATDISVNVGQTVDFKIKTDAAAYTVDIYRSGYYGGLGARKVATVTPSATLPQTQPACLTDASTQLYDCGTWGVSASWLVPADAVSGVYFARLTRSDNGGASHVMFVVRDDTSTSDLVFQTSDTTWQAYNTYGGSSLYVGSLPVGRAYKVSYNRPFDTRAANDGVNFYFGPEFAMVGFLEANGYDVSYIAGVDTDRNGGLLTNHRTFLSVGHDEYWSGAQRANVEAARDAGVNLAFFSGNEVYWRTRYEASPATYPGGDSSLKAGRTLVCYKETKANAKIDPEPTEWTGTWRDPRFATPSNGGGRPENGLTGTMYYSDTGRYALEVPEAEGKLRLWRDTSVASLAPGRIATLGPDTLGYEFDEDTDNAARPAGLIRMSSTTKTVESYLVDHGYTTLPGPATHHLTLYRAGSGALVFGAGTILWAFGLGTVHEGGSQFPGDPAMRQATVNLLADMGAQPDTLLNGLTAATASTDTTPPSVTITSPAAGATVTGPGVTITGTATDAGGGRVGGVEVSTDGGTTWHPATGRESWTYTVTPGGARTLDVRARAADDSANLGAATGVRSLVVACPCTIFPDTTPAILSTTDRTSQGIEVGVTFVASTSGYVAGVRFYKGPQNSGTHVGRLWSPSGVLLASATFSNETDRGWQTVRFSTPVRVVAGATYTASYHAPRSYYSTTAGFFTGDYLSPPLTAKGGVYRYGPGGVFPTDSFPGMNYWVDVVFSGTANFDVTAPAVLSQTPRSSAAGVDVGAPVAVRFDQAVATGYDVQVTDDAGAPVLGSTSWDPVTDTLSFTPAAPFAVNTAYTVVVSGVRDSNGNVAAPVTWSFSTAQRRTPVQTLFGQSVPDTPSGSDNRAIEVGVRFTADRDGFVNAVRFYRGVNNTGTHVGRLWNQSSPGSPLGQVTFSGETATGWQTATFPTPIAVTAGTVYVASYFAPSGAYAVTCPYFSVPSTSGNLTATQGLYRYGTGGVMPTDTFGNCMYWVDVEFQAPALPVDANAPVVMARTPTVGATAVQRDAVVTATFDEQLVSGFRISVAPAGGGAVVGSTSWNPVSRTLAFTPTAPLEYQTAYAVTVTGVQDGSGNTAPPVTWSFTTRPAPDTTAPVVVSRAPAPGATGVLRETTVAITFDEPIVPGYAISVTPEGGTAVAGTAAWQADTRTLSFTPSTSLAYATSYAVSVTGVKDAAGNSSSPVTWSFRTLAAPDVTAPVVTTSALPSVSLGAPTLRWTATDDVGVAVVRLRIRTGPGAARLGAWSDLATLPGSATSYTVRGVAAGGLCLEVTATDAAGTRSAPSVRCTGVPLDDRVLAASRGGWVRATTAGTYLRTSTVSTRGGAYLSRARVYGSGLTLLVAKGPNAGTIGVYVNNRLVSTVRLAAARAAVKQQVTVRTGRMSNATVVLKVVAAGRGVSVDGLAVAP